MELEQCVVKYVIVDPRHRSASIVDASDGTIAMRRAGLSPAAVDHGTVVEAAGRQPGVGIIVAEGGMFEPPAAQSYFAIDRRLYAGAAVLYGFDTEGRTVDLNYFPAPTWLRNQTQVEIAIAIGTVERPEMAFKGNVYWHWPQPRPSGSRAPSVAKTNLPKKLLKPPGSANA